MGDGATSQPKTPRLAGRRGRATRQGAVYGVASQLVKQVLSVVATVVLARILTPADFGIVAAANALLGLAVIGTTLGIGPSVVRRANLDQTFLSTMFWAGLAIAILAAGALAGLSPLLASAFGKPEAAPYVAALAPGLVCEICAAIPLALLQRELRFTAMYGTLTAAMVCYVAVQITLALAGFGAWAVIIGQLSMAAVSLIGAAVLARWRPRARFDLDVLRSELSFASGILTGQLLSYGVKNVDYWIVGRAFSGPQLGIYYIAYTLPSIIRLRMSNVSRQVLFPVFADNRGDAADTRRVYAATMRLQLALGIPAMAGLAVLAEPIVQVFFGSQWDGAVAPMRWLAIASMFEIVTGTPGSIAIAQGRLRLYLSSLVVRLVILLAILVAAARLGDNLETLAIGVVAASVLGAVVTQVVVTRPLGLPSRLVLWPLLRAALPAAVMYAVLWAILRLSDLPAFLELLLLVPVGMACHLVTVRLLSSREYAYLRGEAGKILRSMMRPSRP